MRSRRPSFGTIKSSTIIMDKGLNENVSSIELAGGELISEVNYQLVAGSQGGYQSISGYERYDGKTSPSSVVAAASDFTAREAARDAIDPVPGEGPVLAVHVFEGDVYAFRNKVGGLTAGMYVSSPTGWVEIDTSAAPLNPSGKYHFVNHNFYATVATISMFWCDGVNKARYYDGTSVNVIDNTGRDPNDKPINIIVHNERLFLAYPLGLLEYTNVGNPNDFSTSSGEMGMGREITNLISGVGNALTIYCDQAIKILEGTADSATWELKSFSTSSGAYPNTAKRLLGTIFTLDDRGVTTIEAVQEYGNFAANNISQKVQKTLQDNRNRITTALVSREYNQYKLFFNNNFGIIFSFLNKKLRGITFTKYLTSVLTATEGEDKNGNSISFFTDDTGYVYQMDIGTSFDGQDITSSLKTSYYHYGSSRNWKRFKMVVLEIASRDDIEISIRDQYGYQGSFMPRSESQLEDLSGSGDNWGEGIWGTMKYSGAEVTNRLYHYLKGIGANMSISITHTSKFARPHTVQNMTTDFEISRRQI